MKKIFFIILAICTNYVCTSQTKSVPDSIIYQVYPILQDAILSFRISNLSPKEKELFNSKYFSYYQSLSDLNGLEYFLGEFVPKEKIHDYHLIFDSISFMKVNYSTNALRVYKTNGLRFTNYPSYPANMDSTTKAYYSKFKYDTIYIKENPDLFYSDKIFTLEKNSNTNCKTTKKYFVLSGNASLDTYDFFCETWNRKTDLLDEWSVKKFILYRSADLDVKDLIDANYGLIHFDTTNYFGYLASTSKVLSSKVFILAPKKLSRIVKEGIQIIYYTNDTSVTGDSLKNTHKIIYHLDIKPDRLYSLKPVKIKYTADRIKDEWLNKQIVSEIFRFIEYPMLDNEDKKKQKNKSK